MKLFSTTRRWAVAACCLVAAGTAHGQALAPTLLDDFNRPDSPTVGTGWVETETTPGTGAAIVGNQLKLSSGVLGKDFVSRNVSARYSPVLRQNADPLTWLFNMQQSRPNPSGFGPNNYGAAFVLAGSAADFTTGNGYAVVYGNAGQPDSLKLVRYTGGLTGPLALRTLAAVSVPAATGALTGPAHTVRVLFDPDEDNWTLEVSANTTSFDAPLTATYVRIGVRKDSAFTTTALPWLGCFWNHATTAAENAVFDNLYVTAPCALGPEPSQGAAGAAVANLTSTSATLSWTAGNGTGRVVVVRPNSAPVTAPTDGSVYNGNTAFGSGSGLGAGGFVVYAGAGSTVNVTNLQPGTAYAFQVYELLGTGCATNYLQAGPATGTFTTAPCVLAAFPTQDATNATAVSAGRTAATVSWTPGNGTNALVVVRPNTSVLTLPASGTGYTGNAAYGGGSALGGGFVVYAGASTSSVTVTNLVPGTSYRIEVYPYNGIGCSAAYRTSFFASTAYTVPVPPVGTLLPFRGNIHAHSSYSDGNQDGLATTPMQDFQYAAASLHTDFLGISEHNHAQAGMSLPNYARGLTQAAQATTPTFAALYGMEWGVISGGGHVVVYGVSQLLGWEPGNYDVFVAKNDYQGLFRQLNRRPGAFGTLAHPNLTDYGNLLFAPFSARADSAIVGTVLRSGPATSTNTSYSNPSGGSYSSYFRALLAKGYHVGISLDHDNHNTTFLRTTPGRLVVLAPALTPADLLDALRQRHFYASDDWNAEVTFTLNNQPMGSVFAGQGPSPAAMAVGYSDADGEALTSLRLLRGVPGSGSQAVVVATAPAGATALSYVDPLAPFATAYYYAVLRQADGDSIVTSPIWYTNRIITATAPQAEALGLSVFPNPTVGPATLSYFLPATGPVSAEVYDAVGRIVNRLAVAEQQAQGPHTLTVPALVPGLYTVRVTYRGQAIFRKLLVQ